MDEILKDPRFSHVINDPRFKRIPKSERKVKIDKRFQSIFNDNKFKVKYTVDKRGRPINHSTNDDLKRYYDISSESDGDESDTKHDKKQNEPGKFVRAPTNSDEEEVSDSIKKKLHDLKVDYARGEGRLLSESSSDDEQDDESDVLEDEEGVEHDWGELDKDADKTDTATYRLAACNMNWDRIRAVDLMVLFNSFLPSNGIIKSITIYPSDYGLERMKEEEINGPMELVSNDKSIIENDDENEDENEEGSKYHMEKLRQYQLNRLKYYYAVIVCDSAKTADKLYTECDGLEYESSATIIDLRFIPDDVTFDHEPKEVCDKLPDLNRYQPRYFTTTALQQAKVHLTWDETNPERSEMAQKLMTGKIDDITDADLENYLAVSSSGEDDNSENEIASLSDNDGNMQKENDCINKYKQLLSDIDQQEKAKKERDVEMEVSWGVDLKEKTDELIKQKQKNTDELTPFEKYLEKKKAKRKAKKEALKQLDQKSSDSEDDIPSDIDMNDPYFADEFKDKSFVKTKKKKNNKTNDKSESDSNNTAELELLLMNENDDGKKHFSLKKIQEREAESKTKKKKLKNAKETDDNFQIDVTDNRFAAVFHSHHFNIDPTDPHFKKTKGMEALIQEKIKRRQINDTSDESVNSKKIKTDSVCKNAELNALVKSVKRKAENFSNRK